MSPFEPSDQETRFDEMARAKLDFLVTDYGFRVLSEERDMVRLESPKVGLLASCSPRGEVELRAWRIKDETPFGTWSYLGLMGSADASRLLEIAVEQLVREPAILAGDDVWFDALAAAQELASAEWTQYYAGRGPRPITGRLP